MFSHINPNRCEVSLERDALLGDATRFPQVFAKAAHLDEPVQQVRRILNVGVRVGGELAERVEDIVEEDDEVAARHLGDVVKRLARVVAHAAVLVREGVENWGNDALQKWKTEIFEVRTLGMLITIVVLEDLQ